MDIKVSDILSSLLKRERVNAKSLLPVTFHKHTNEKILHGELLMNAEVSSAGGSEKEGN